MRDVHSDRLDSIWFRVVVGVDYGTLLVTHCVVGADRATWGRHLFEVRLMDFELSFFFEASVLRDLI